MPIAQVRYLFPHWKTKDQGPATGDQRPGTMNHEPRSGTMDRGQGPETRDQTLVVTEE